MGGREAAATAERLLAEGRRPDLPVVVVENCSRPDQRILRLTLEDLAHGLETAHGPVLVMIGEALAQKDSVRLAGFGNFSVSSRPEREGRNPQTGANITIKASSNVSFKAASGLKDSLN